MKKCKWIPIAAAVIAAAFLFLWNSPRFRSELFVKCYANQLENNLTIGTGLPAENAGFAGYKMVNIWEGEHTITEFIIMTRGNRYFGVYYSQDDVPAGFQNVPVKLIQDGHDYWEWQCDGDNHGSTAKIQDHWYYFEASF